MCLAGQGSIDVYLFPRFKERVDFNGFGGYVWNYIQILWIWICCSLWLWPLVLLAVCVDDVLFWNLAWALNGSHHFHPNRISIGRFLVGNFGLTNLKIHRFVMSRFKMWSRNWIETMFLNTSMNKNTIIWNETTVERLLHEKPAFQVWCRHTGWLPGKTVGDHTTDSSQQEMGKRCLGMAASSNKVIVYLSTLPET